MTRHVAVVGAGLIGRAWTISFARGGRDVVLWDVLPGMAEETRHQIPTLLEGLKEQDLLEGQSVNEVFQRISATADLSQALQGAIHVQENAPEKIGCEKRIIRET
jgi:3-hydroxyacyl-CoA dehydrogenase